MRSLVALLVLLVSVFPLAASEWDDCDANFIAFVGSSAYRFSPHHDGDLGAVRLFAILSYQRAAQAERYGFAVWRLDIDRADSGERILTTRGRGRIDQQGAAIAELYWDGRDARGELVAEGRYRYTFSARFIADRDRKPRVLDYDALDVPPYDEALASSDEVIVEYGLEPQAASRLRIGANATSCSLQQNAPMEAGFAYNFYYGSTHAHSNWSDGGHPTTNCTSGASYGSGTFAPSSVFAYARDEAKLDFWVVNEHNHLIADAISNNNAPLTEAKVKQRYADGIAAANAATTSTFVGIYGMEWGVTTNSDQGHVTLLETPKLFGWETCTTCNGPNIECTPGTNCYFDVFTPKRFGYLTLYARSVENPSSAGALGIFNHPSSGNFDNFAYDSNADDAIQGIAVRSGLAFSTATDCANGNVGASDYTARWKEALNKGFHVAPTADHDSHCNNYGTALPTRTVYLAPSLTKANLLAAHRARRFYATEDPNAQLVFRTADGAHVMGEIFTSAGGATLVANVYDPDGEGASTIEIWRGTIGGGVPASAYATFSNQTQVTLTETLTSGTYWYYVRVVQPDGHDLWSAPMWISYQLGGGGGDTILPSTSITAPLNGATVSAATTVTASATDNVGVTKVEFYLDGNLQSTDTSSPYAWSWDTTAAANGTHTLQSKAYDAANNVGSSVTVTVTVSNAAPPAGADVSGWKITQANATYEFTLPAGTVIPQEGYLVIARQADKAAFESFWSRSLGTNVVFINSNGGMPVINGDETYTLTNASGAIVDGPTPAILVGRTMQRNDPCTTTWTSLAETSANPGSGAAAGCAGGVKLSEYADASGTGMYIYEFIELHYDSAAAGDTQPPSTSITAPGANATVSGTTSVTASATDNVGVTKVEFYLDGVLKSTDTSSPYAWSWDTLTAANGAHTLQSKAYDAANNVGSSASISVTVSNGTPVDVGGYRLAQTNAALNYTIPAGTTIPSKGYLIIARNATKAAFETFWGVTLGANVVFLNAGDAMPQINGSESYTLYDASNTKIDGATPAMASAGGESLRRLNGCSNKTNAWTRGATSLATPGSGAPAPCSKGAYISEFSDALGTGNYVYEFVELHNDK